MSGSNELLIIFPLFGVRCWSGSDFCGVFHYSVCGVVGKVSMELYAYVELRTSGHWQLLVVIAHHYLSLVGNFRCSLTSPYAVQGCM